MTVSSGSYWEATATPVEIYPTLKGSIKADIAIVGGGYLGLSCALHLAEMGKNVVVLEAHTPGWGASGRNGGQIIPGFKHERQHMIAKLGQDRGRRLFSWSGTFVNETLDIIRRHGINCDASKSGWIQPAHSRTALRDYETRVDEWSKEGADPHIVDAATASELLGTTWYVGAYIDPRGGRLHPMKYAMGLAKAARQQGAQIFEQSPVQTVERKGDNWHISTAGGRVKAERVLICTNAYTDAGKPLIAGLAQSVVPVPSYMVATAPLSAKLRKSVLPKGHTAADLKKLTNHFRLEPDGRFLFGGRGRLRETAGPSGYAPLKAKLAELFPQLSDVPLEHHWNGRVAITVDGAPHLHNPAPGLWASVGCNGRGVGYATVTGKLMSSLITGADPDDSPIPVSQIRRIPFHKFHLIGASFAVWRKNRQDEAARTARVT